MKCGHVQSIIVEYAEGALCVADELCVDIHMVQCESCRGEARSIALLEAAVARGLDAADVPPQTVKLLERLDALMQAPKPATATGVRRFGGTALRTAIFAGVLIVALASSAANWRWDAANFFGMLPAEAATSRPLVETVRPLASEAELDELRDLNDLTGPVTPFTDR